MVYSATIVTESYNLGAGQSLNGLRRALTAATRAAQLAHGGPHKVLLVDASGTTTSPATAVVEQLRSSTGVSIAHAVVPANVSYDTLKDVAANLCDTDVVAYLDGDCVPVASPERWLNAMLDKLAQPGVVAVTGTTAYEGTSALQLACTTIDFGFQVDNPGGPVGCYASNNVAFLRAGRAQSRTHCDGLRCSCYIHAQQLLRNGTPVHHAASPDARVRHERVPFFDERLRRGHDAVTAAHADPSTIEASYLAGPRWRACMLGVVGFTRSQRRFDRVRLPRVADTFGASRRARALAPWWIGVLRLVEMVGMWSALIAGPSRRWQHNVPFEEALACAMTTIRRHAPQAVHLRARAVPEDLPPVRR